MKARIVLAAVAAVTLAVLAATARPPQAQALPITIQAKHIHAALQQAIYNALYDDDEDVIEFPGGYLPGDDGTDIEDGGPNVPGREGDIYVDGEGILFCVANICEGVPVAGGSDGDKLPEGGMRVPPVIWVPWVDYIDAATGGIPDLGTEDAAERDEWFSWGMDPSAFQRCVYLGLKAEH